MGTDDTKILKLLKEALKEMETTKSTQYDDKSRFQQIEITELQKLIAFHLIYVEP